MTTSSPMFFVFDSRTGSKPKDGGLIYCQSRQANVQWPRMVRRGRPRKDQKGHGGLSERIEKQAERPSKERFEFVDCSDGRRRNDLNTQKFVRTHVMHDYQRRKKKAVHAKAELQDTGAESPENDTDAIVEVERSHIPSLERWSQDPFDSFPIKMQPHMHELLHLYLSGMAGYLYPIEAVWGLNPAKKLWVPMALTDSALLNSILFCSHQFWARAEGQAERPSAINFLQQTITIVNERLQEPLQKMSDSTIAAVVGLALTEQFCGNQANWRIHMRGMKQMVEIRGGLSAFESNPILHDKICRADICGSVYELSEPCLQMGNGTIQPFIVGGCDDTERIRAPGFQAVYDDHGLDSDLLDVLCSIHAVAQIITTTNPPKSDVTPLRLHKSIRSIQYYLLNHDGISGAGDPVLKACHLGVLFFLGIIQNDFWVSPMSRRCTWQLKSYLQSAYLTADSMLRLHLWLMFLAGSVVLDPADKSWFVRSISQVASQLSLSNWCDAKLLLETFAWAGKIQDRSGRDLWDDAMTLRMQRILSS